MATKVTKLKPANDGKIVFIYYQNTCGTNGDISNIIYEEAEASQAPEEWDNICLLYKDYYKGYDLMFCSNDKLGTRALFLGHFNDGIV